MVLRFLQLEMAAFDTPNLLPKSVSLLSDRAVFRRSNMSSDEKVSILCTFIAKKFCSKQIVY